MSVEKNIQREILETDVVVLGGGGSGLAAACSAIRNGAKVVLLEKRKILGGNSAMAWAIFGVNTLVQLQNKSDAEADPLFRTAMRFSNWTVEPKLVRTLINRSTEVIHWLMSQGMTFQLGSMWPNQTPRVDHINPKGGPGIIELLSKFAEENGGKIICGFGGKEIILAENGKAAGVIAENKEGDELEVRAKSVVIATGGFGGNKELLEKNCRWYTENVKLLGVPNMGDGYTMANKIGAASTDMAIHGEAAGFVPGGGDAMMAVVQEPYTLWLNKKGERFVDEAYTTQWNVFEATAAVVRQPESKCWAILDSAMKERLETKGFIHGWREFGPGRKATKLHDRFVAAEEKGSVKVCNTLDEVAKFIGADPEVLKETVDSYNAQCDNKHDDEMAKESRYMIPIRKAPYYVVLNYAVMLGTFGGIKINHKAEVLNENDKPIPGVYAAGIDSGGWANEHYNSHLSGHAFGFSLYSGDIAGESAAKLAKK